MNRAIVVAKRTGDGTTENPYRPVMSAHESWHDITGQPTAYLLVGATAFTIEAILTDAQLATVEVSADHAVLWSVDTEAENQTPPDLDAAGIAALKTKIENLYYSDVAELVTEMAVNPADIADELIAVQLRPPWQSGISAQVGEVYQYDGNLYEVIQAHTTQADWLPNVVPALFKRFYEPDDDPWPWVQPLGAHDAYPIGARVLHNGFTWQSEITANVFEPGSVGAETLWTNLTPPPPTPEWQIGVAYTGDNTAGSGNGDEVTYQGNAYRCLQSHTSIASWNPPAVPALWQLL